MDKKQMEYEIELLRETVRELRKTVSVLNILVKREWATNHKGLSYSVEEIEKDAEGKPKNGDLFSRADFAEMVNFQSVTDYDGFGRFANLEFESDIEVVPSIYYELLPYVPAHFTHVMWYNK